MIIGEKEGSLLAADDLQSAALRLALLVLAVDLDQRDLVAGLAALQEISRENNEKHSRKVVLNGSQNSNHLLVASYGSFAEDSWKVSSRLTLNLGLRWEINKPVVDSAGRLSNFDPALKGGDRFHQDPGGDRHHYHRS